MWQIFILLWPLRPHTGASWSFQYVVSSLYAYAFLSSVGHRCLECRDNGSDSCFPCVVIFVFELRVSAMRTALLIKCRLLARENIPSSLIRRALSVIICAAVLHKPSIVVLDDLVSPLSSE